MGDLHNAEKPRKLLRWTESSGDDLNEVQDPNTETNKQNTRVTDKTTEKPGSNSDNPNVNVLSKREDWYGAKMKRLKDSVEKLRKDLRDKERDYIRLKNKYNVSKRRQEQLQEDLRNYTDVKLDAESEVEFLRLQLLESEKELLKYRKIVPACIKPVERRDCAVEDNVDGNEASLESCLGDSIFAGKYLNIHQDFRRWLVYGLLGTACGFSMIALIYASSLLSSFAVGSWTLGLFCLWQERKELYRALKLKHMKKIREMSRWNAQLREEKRKLNSQKKELEKELHQETENKNEIALEFKSVSEKLADVKFKNEELVKRDKSISEKLQSERIRRRRAEERLEEVTAQALLEREENELAKCGDICKKLRGSLNLERELKEKLSRENQRLVEEIVAMNMEEQKRKMKWEKEDVEEQVAEVKKLENHEEMPIAKMKVEIDVDNCGKGETEYEEGKPEKFESKVKISREPNLETSPGPILETSPEPILETSPEPKAQASKERENQISTFSVGDGKVVKQDGEIVAPELCWFCLLHVPTEIRIALFVTLLACFVSLIRFALSLNIYLFTCLLSILLVGGVKYSQVVLESKVKPSR